MTPSRGAVLSWVRRVVPWAGLAFVAGLAGVAGSYVAVGRTPAFVAAPVDGLVLALTPTFVFRFVGVFDGLGQLVFALAILATAGVLAFPSLPGVLALRNDQRVFGPLLGAALVGVTTVALAGSVTTGVGAGLGAGIAFAVAAAVPTGDAPVSRVRRRLLGAIGTVAAVGVVGALLRRTDGPTDVAFVTAPEGATEEVAEALDAAAEQSLDVAGLEPLVSTDFYEVDINSVNPEVDPETWTLSVTGAVETERTYDLADLQAMPREDRFVSLRCVGDELNGRKLDTALWSGVPVTHVLEPATPQGQYVMPRAADGYYNEFPIAALRPGLLADGMTGRDLPRAHGAPVRALVPGHWGEINVKWLTEIEVLDRPAKGYWEKRGWHGIGPVHTVAKRWATNHLADGRIEVAGPAYAGTRGIDRVEVSTDGGESWTAARLSEPLPGDDVWRQWVHRYRAEEKHEVVVRAVDGTGTTQSGQRQLAYPSGATGWVSTTVPP